MKNSKILKKIAELTARDTKNLTQRSLKTCEEAGELAAAVLSYTLGDYKVKERKHILEEAMDTAMCGFSVAIEAGFSFKEMEEEMLNKLDKWERVIDLMTKNSTKG